MLERDAYRERMFLKGVILLLTAVALGSFLWVALSRMAYPYEIESGEGLVAESVFRILEGKNLYPPPSLDFIPVHDNPLFYYLSAGMMYLFGHSIAVIRMVSLISTISISLLFYRFLRRTGVIDFFALGGVGIYLGAYAALGNWYDLAEPDSLALLFGIASLTIAARNSKNRRYPFLAGFFAALAFFTDGIYIVLFLLLIVHYAYLGKQKFKAFFIPASVLIIGGTTILLYFTEGWYWFYVVKYTMHGNVIPQRFLTFWTNDLFLKFPIFSILSWGGLYGLFRLLKNRRASQSDSAMAILTGSFFTIALLNRVFENCSSSSLIPAAIVIAGLVAWSLQHFYHHEYGLGWLLPVTVKLMVIIQMLIFLYKPYIFTPTAEDLKAGEEFIGKLSSYRGDVYLPSHPYYCRLAGKLAFFDFEEIKSLSNFENTGLMTALSDSLEMLINDQWFSVIIIDEPVKSKPPGMQQNYRLMETAFPSPTAFFPLTGNLTRPQFIYLPK